MTSVNRYDVHNREIPDFYEVVKAIKCLSRGKSKVPDGVSAEHLILTDKQLYVYLSFLSTFMFRYSVVPEIFLYVFITPIVKNKGGNLYIRDNYIDL